MVTDFLNQKGSCCFLWLKQKKEKENTERGRIDVAENRMPCTTNGNGLHELGNFRFSFSLQLHFAQCCNKSVYVRCISTSMHVCESVCVCVCVRMYE